jgi:membrane protease subunit HflK
VNRVAIAAVVLLVGYLASGVFVIGSSDKGVIRRFGRAAAELRGSGLWWEPPWPFTRIDRVNVAAVRSVSLAGAINDSSELLPADQPRSPAMVTGDNNLLNVRATVQFHLHPDHVAEFLFRHRDPERTLTRLLEAAVAEAATRSGVDYLQTAGLTELNRWLKVHVQQAAEAARLGIEVDQVTLDRVDPPTLVQADFLDVANARAEAARARHEAETAGEQRQAEAVATVRQQMSAARQQSQSAITAAAAQADRFRELIAQLRTESEQTGRPYADCRAAAMDRMTTDTLSAALSRMKKQWVFDAKTPVDLHLRAPD